MGHGYGDSLWFIVIHRALWKWKTPDCCGTKNTKIYQNHVLPFQEAEFWCRICLQPMLRNNSRLMKCFKCQLKCAGNPEGNLSHFPSAMTPREIMANQKWSKWSTWSRDHETIRTCAENAVDAFHVSCLPRRRWRVRRLGRQFVPYGRRGRFKFSFGHLLISFGHLLDILYAHLMSSYVVLHHLTSSYVFLLQTMVLLTWCVLCRPSICRRSISLISHLFGFNLPSWGLPRWCGCKWVKTSKKDESTTKFYGF